MHLSVVTNNSTNNYLGAMGIDDTVVFIGSGSPDSENSNTNTVEVYKVLPNK